MKKFCLFVVVIALVFSTFSLGCSADARFDYTLDSVKIKSNEGVEVDELPKEGFTIEAVASMGENAKKPKYMLFAIYGGGSLIDVRMVTESEIKDGKLVFGAKITGLTSDADLVRTFIWDGKLNPLSKTGDSNFSKAPVISGNKNAAITGISFIQRGMYIMMSLEKPADMTGITGFEAIIYDKNNPEKGVHRSITLEEASAHYRLDDPEIFNDEQEYNTVKVISNADGCREYAVWESAISVVPSPKDVLADDVYVAENNEIDIKFTQEEKGYLHTVYTRKDGSVIKENYYDHKGGVTLRCRKAFDEWSDDDKRLLENGEVSVTVKGMNITKMEPVNGKWIVEFERIRAASFAIRCDIDIVQ